MTSTSVARLRRVLGGYFEPAVVDSAFRAMRAAGIIEAGASGYGGCRSAPLDARQTALILLALSSDVHPKNAPAEAERVGRFRLLRRDTGVGDTLRSELCASQQFSLLDAIVCELDHGVDDPDHPPSSWAIAAHGACQVSPEDRLVFGPSIEALSDPSDSVVRSCLLPARLLADIALLFRQDRAEAA